MDYFLLCNYRSFGEIQLEPQDQIPKFSNLQELRDIVEQIDMAATFVKIGGFGRLIALVGPGYRPEKVQLYSAPPLET